MGAPSLLLDIIKMTLDLTSSTVILTEENKTEYKLQGRWGRCEGWREGGESQHGKWEYLGLRFAFPCSPWTTALPSPMLVRLSVDDPDLSALGPLLGQLHPS